MDENLDLRITAALETADAANSAKELKASMRELNALAEQVGVSNAAAYNQIKQAAGEAAMKVREMNASTKALAGTPLQATTKSFGLIKESLMTMNFDQLTKSVTLFSGSLSKMNPGGLAEGFGKLGSSLATLGKALLTNPIFLIGAAVVLIITQFDKLKEAGGVIGKVFSAIGSVIHTVIKAITDFTDAIGLTDVAGQKAMEARLKNLEKEKSAVDEKYEHEVKMAELSGKSVAAAEAAKFAAQKQFAKETIAIYERIKDEKGHLTEEETAKYKEALVEYKKIQDAEAEYVAETTKKILDTEKEVLKKIKQAKIENISDETAKKKAQADFDLDEKKEEIQKTNKEQAEGLEKLRLAEIAAANNSGEQIKEINERYAKAKRLIDRESNAAEVEATTKKNNDITKANEEAAKKAQEELKKKFDQELKLNADEQAIITGNLNLSETERTNQLKHNLDLRNEILIREKKARILNGNEATNEIIKNTQTEQKLDKDLAKAQEEAAKAEAERIKKLKNEELSAAITIATEKKKSSDNLQIQLAADVELAKLNAQKRVLNEKLTTQQTIQLWAFTLAVIEKLKEDYAAKARLLELTDNQKAIAEELKTVEKKKGIWLGTELNLLKQLQKSKQALLDEQLKQELKKEEGNAKATAAIWKKYNADTLKNTEDTNANKAADALKTINQIGGYAQQGLQGLSALNDIADQADKNRLKAGQKLSEETQKKEFKRKQGLSLANAIINTAEGISKAVAESPDTGGLPGSALAAVMGGLQIAKILSTKFEASGGDSGGGGSAPTVPTISAPSLAAAPSLNSSGSSFRPGQFYGIGTANYSNGLSTKAQPQQVYVLESDITTTQNKVSVQSGRATLSGRH